MAKDPAFLFYPSDFLTGTMAMPFEDRGKYITLLCYQHQSGRMSNETISFLVGSVSDMLRLKFSVDENGLFYNKRLEEEIFKRDKFIESRRNNGSMGGRPKLSTKPLAKPNGKPTQNLPVNRDINENVVDIPSYKLSFDFYKKELFENFELIKTDNEFLEEQERFNPNVDIILSIEKSIANFWGLEAGWKNKKNSKNKSINWKSTFSNAISNPLNKVYKNKNNVQPTSRPPRPSMQHSWSELQQKWMVL
jgi:hypothetical protein